MIKILSLVFIFMTSLLANVEKKDILSHLNFTAIITFLIFVVATLFITYKSAKRTKTAKDFYTAKGGISGLQNGLAISGDYMSAASFLGISGLIYMHGFDGIIYLIGFLVGWPIIMFLLAEQLRNLGKYTFTDAVAYRLKQVPIRTVSSIGSIATVLIYLVAQMIGSGKLIELLFGIPYTIAVTIMGVLMTALVSFGGMLATTWVQIIKAIFLLAGASTLALLVTIHFGFNPEALFQKAVDAKGSLDIIESGNLINDPISAVSLGIALMFGTAGLPHILMRFFTVADAKEARKSVFFATGFIGYFYILTFFIGFGSIAFIASNPEYLNFATGLPIGGENMVALHLSHALGGNILLGVISAVAFATILAVVAGLTLAGASAVSHDLYANVFAKNRSNEIKEMKISKLATMGLGFFAIIFGISFKNQNIAYLVSLAFALAASTNFPLLFLSIYWKRLTTRGAVIGGSLGLITAVGLIILGPVVWGEILNGNANDAIFPFKYPALFSVSISFIAIWFFSITDKSENAKKEIKAYDNQYVRSQTGIGADSTVDCARS